MSVRHRARQLGHRVRRPLKYLDHEHTFTPGMAKREGAGGVFAAAPIVQGQWDGTGTPDSVTFPNGDQITGLFRSNIDYYQGSVSFWVTPEWDGNDGLAHDILTIGTNSIQVMKDTDDRLYLRYRDPGGIRNTSVDISAWTAGTTYNVVGRWDGQNELDGSNHLVLSINDVHSFGANNVTGTYAFPTATHYIGSDATPANGGDAIIEGLHIFRRVLYDGEFGVDANGVDEINAIWAAGVGADPTLITGSFDCVFGNPTDSAVGALVTGAGEAWSHPHSSNVPHEFYMHDGYHGGNHNAVEYNATTTDVDCGSAAVLDNIPAADFTWECWVKLDSAGENNAGRLFDKDSANFVALCRAGAISVEVNHVTSAATAEIPFAYDGKWHHLMAVWDVGTLSFEHFFLDGRDLIENIVAGVGAYSGDAAADLHIGNDLSGDFTLDGAMAWFRFSDNKRNVADFIAPRLFPAADGNTIEAWSFDDGTGAVVVAQVATPGNDGALANGTWITPWAEEGTPLSVQGIEFDGAATSVRIPDAAALQDLTDNAFTVEAWVRADSFGESNNGNIFFKGRWIFQVSSSAGLRMRVLTAGTNGEARCGTDEFSADGKLHHVAMQYDDGGDRKPYFWVDGIPVASYTQQIAAIGAILSDIGTDLFLGNDGSVDFTFDGLLGGWCRISNISRYTNGEAFPPPAPTNAPGLDANAVWQTDYSDGAGLVLTDDSATASDGVITIGSGRWWNTRDANLNDAGEMPYGAGGYMFGTDAANEGIEQTWAGLTPGENYVVRAVVFPTADGTAYAQLAIRDETNGANIVLFNGPRYAGAHTGANNSATLINAGARWPQSLVGATVYNITDGSFADITDISGDGTTITAALAGGTDDDWDTGDVHRIVWAVATDPINDGYWRHPWIETFTFELPTMARNGVGADCVSISARILNVNNDGTLVCAQLELLENLIDNPGLETGAGNPFIPDGWTNNGLDPGDSVASSAGAGVIHSGSDAMQFNAGAATNEFISRLPAGTAGRFYAIGAWMHTDGRYFASAALYSEQAALAGDVQLDHNVGAVWQELRAVARQTGATGQALLLGRAAQLYNDDIYIFELDPVTLTVTPASEANSLESGGIRVDGYDALTQPVLNRLKARSGHVIWRARLRHNPANIRAFDDGTQVRLLDIRAAGVWMMVDGNAADTMRLRFDDGGGAQVVNWAAAAAWDEDEELFFEAYWRGHFMQLALSGIPVATINGPVDYATVLTLAYWGMGDTGARQIDLVIKEP